MKNLEAHLSSLKKNQTALIVGNRDSFIKYGVEITRFKKKIKLINLEMEIIPFNEEFAIVIVLGKNIRESHSYYSKCNPFKDKGIPVVFGIDERALTYDPPTWKDTDLTIKGMFYLASQYLQGLSEKGAYLEFGVFDGRSFTIACHALRNICSDFLAFDSFEGIVGSLPEETRLFNNGSYYANIETFWHNMNVAGVSDLSISTIKGAFQDTLYKKKSTDYGIGPISIVHIDSDIAEAALLALEFISPSLLDGALILFDEFHAFGANNNKGERLAFNKWLEKRPEFSAEIYKNYTAVSRSYIIHRKS